MDKLVSITDKNLEYVKTTAKKEGLPEKKVIERCVTYCRKHVIKIETTVRGDECDMSKMQD